MTTQRITVAMYNYIISHNYTYLSTHFGTIIQNLIPTLCFERNTFNCGALIIVVNSV